MSKPSTLQQQEAWQSGFELKAESPEAFGPHGSPVECCGARDTAFRSRVIHGREKIQRTLLQSCVYWKWPHSRALKPSSMHRCVLTFSRSPSLHDLCGRLSNGQLLARKRSDLDRTFAKAHGELVEFLWILTPMLDHLITHSKLSEVQSAQECSRSVQNLPKWV